MTVQYVLQPGHDYGREFDCGLKVVLDGVARPLLERSSCRLGPVQASTRGFYPLVVDAATVDALVEIAERAHARARQPQPGATSAVENRYPEMREALDWCLASGQPDKA